MDHELPKAYDPALIEEKWAKFWADEHLFDVPTPPQQPVILSGARTGVPAEPFSLGGVESAESKDPDGAGSTHTVKSLSANHPFVQLLPPPNVTGRLHMGHMLNQTEMDILTRWHRMLGDTSLWVPGTDHAGIATQMMVERQLTAEGTTRETLGREAFTARVWDWKQQYGSAITEQMKRLGASVDWSREYFTMDARLSVAVQQAFVRLWNQGLIYRGAYIVNWDPQLQSAVSDLEVESEERAGYLYHVRYDLADGSLPDGTASITIATTRPETMLGDTAVAVNPQDARYQHLIGKLLVLPLSAAAGKPDRTIPILADDWAQPEFGTGAVKVTPAHDPNDFALGQRHNLPSPSIMDTRARIALAGSPYDKLDRFEARQRIVADLESSGHLVAVKDHTLTLPISQRTGAVIEPRLSLQWFLAVNKTPTTATTQGAPGPDSGTWEEAPGAPSSPTALSPAKVGSQDAPGTPRNSTAANPHSRPSIAQLAIEAVQAGHIRFTPEMYTKTYNEWMSNLHDWCLSRQLWWGHRIPAWHCGACGEINVALEAPTACARCSSTQLTQETDVLDTWFSSGLLPFTVFGWPGSSAEEIRHPDGNAESPDAAAKVREAQSGTPALQGRVSWPAEVREAQSGTPALQGRVSWPAEERGALAPELGITQLTPDLAAFYPTSLLVTGFDILFFWVARMIMLGCHFMLDVPMPDGSPRTLADAVPFRQVYIHALVRDADRQKMSKTKGNVVDPIEIVTKYGTDAVRFTLASQASPGTDIAFNEARTEGYRAFANKIWNAARFLQMNLARARQAGYTVSLPNNDPAHSDAATKEAAHSDAAQNSVILSGARSAQSKDPDGSHPAHDAKPFSTTTPLETRWIFSRLSTVSVEVAQSLAAFRFDEAANAVYQFFWGEFCDWYLELIKLRLTFDTPTPDVSSRPEASRSDAVAERPAVSPATNPTALTLNALVTVFEVALRLLSPFMPFLTEELWHALYASLDQPAPAQSIALTRYPQPEDFPVDESSVAALTTLQDLIVAVRGLRKDLGVPEKESTPITLHANNRIQALIQENADMLTRLARVASADFTNQPLTGSNSRTTPNFDVAVLYSRTVDVPAERERLTRDLAKYTKGLEAANKQLSNDGFLARAPEAIVAGLRKQHAETLALKDKAEAALAALPPN